MEASCVTFTNCIVHSSRASVELWMHSGFLSILSDLLPTRKSLLAHWSVIFPNKTAQRLCSLKVIAVKWHSGCAYVLLFSETAPLVVFLPLPWLAFWTAEHLAEPQAHNDYNTNQKKTQ